MTNLYQITDEALSEEEERFPHEKDSGEDADVGECPANQQGQKAQQTPT